MSRLLRPFLIVIAVAVTAILLSTTSVARSAADLISGERLADSSVPAGKLTDDAQRQFSGIDVQTRSLRVKLTPGQVGGGAVGCGSDVAVSGGIGDINNRVVLETSGPGLVRDGVPYQWSMQYRNPSKTATVRFTIYALCAKSARPIPVS